MPKTNDSQLSFNVEPHPNTRRQDGSVPLHGGLKWGLDISVPGDLQPGDQVTVSVANADGEVIGTTLGKVESVAFVPIKDRGVVIAQVRQHKIKGLE